MAFSVNEIRQDFPILQRQVRGRDLVYLDNAASSQRPRQVIERISRVYEQEYSNIHRGVHYLSNQLSAEYEKARKAVADFFAIPDADELIVTSGTTESLNLVATAWGRANIGKGDVIAVLRSEHHSNFVPWQYLARQQEAEFLIVEVGDNGIPDPASMEQALSRKPKVFAFSLLSNVLGMPLPAKAIATKAKAAGATVVVDAAQAAPHLAVRVPDLGPIDFLACSAHKMCGPSGIGILWGRRSLLEAMPPYRLGGGMIDHVGDQETDWNRLPWKFEAGTPHIAGLIGFAAAVEYLSGIGMDAIHQHETELAKAAIGALADIPGMQIYGPGAVADRSGVISFNVAGVHPADIGSFLDTRGIAVRVGHHCTQPLMRSLGIEGNCRASFYFYNTPDEVEQLVSALREGVKLFQE